FTAAHAAGALTDDFSVLLATRVAAALANAGFLAVALSVVAAVVPAGLRARGLAVVLGGTTLALVAGVPLGAALGAGFGWRSTLWAVAAVSVPALVAVAAATPDRIGDAGRGADGTPGAEGAAAQDARSRADAPGLGAEFAVLRRARLLVALLLGVLVNGATFCAFTYLAPLVTDTAGLSPAVVPAVLALFGAGAFAGVRLAGRYADLYWRALLGWGGGALLLGWGLLAAVAAHPAALLALVPLQGALSFAVGGTLIARVMANAAGAPTMGGSFATAALNLGAAAGPVLGGAAFAAAGARGPVLVAAALVLAALAAGAVHALAGLRSARARACGGVRG
ncbi:MFS transporter, partial [Nocardiopsis flavescens]